jgi:fructan beta-fructosidase
LLVEPNLDLPYTILKGYRAFSLAVSRDLTPMSRSSQRLLAGLIALSVVVSGAQSEELYREPWRPRYHFTPAKNWMNDPNGLVYYEGEYHLFYQYNPLGDKWGHMSWGHAVSSDLLHWEHMPLALPEENDIMIFSGGAVVDWQNTSGFGKDGKPPLVAIYTGHYTKKPLQNQNLAYSNDRGRTWKKYAANPVLDLKEKEFRDPKVIWHEPTRRWVMAVAWPVQRKVRFYASPDLKDWMHLSDFGPAGSVEGVWECPDLFPLEIDGKTKWVLIVSVSSGAPAGGSGGQYFVGDFDGKTFTLDPSYPKKGSGPIGGPALWLDHGPDFYAAVTWSDVPAREGRRILLGWMSNWQYANEVPTSPWRSAMTIPRELALRKTAAGLRLVQKPVAELEKIRGRLRRFQGGTVQEANTWIKQNNLQSDPLEMVIELAPAVKGAAGVRLFKGAKKELVIAMDPEQGTISIDRTRSGNAAFHAKFPCVASVPIARSDDRIRLRLLVDACSVEVFVNDGQQVLTSLSFPSKAARALELFGPDRGETFSALHVWTLASCWKAK